MCQQDAKAANSAALTDAINTKTVDCRNEKGLITKYECPHLGRRSLYFVDTKQQHVSLKRLRYVVLLTQICYITGWFGKQGYWAMCVNKSPRTLFFSSDG